MEKTVKYAQKPALSYQREETLVTSLAEARTALTNKRKIRTGTKKATT